MKEYHVEIVFEVMANDPDDAVSRVRRVLDPVQYDLASGLRGYFTYDDCVEEVKKDES